MNDVLPSLEAISTTVERFRCLKSRNLGKLMHMGWRQYSVYVESRIQDFGYPDFRITMMGVLGNLDPTGNTIVELAEKLKYTKQALGKLVRDMEEGGYVHAETHPNDKRAQLIRFTHKGLKLMEDACTNIGQVRRELTRDLTEEELDQLLALMEKLVASNMPLLENGTIEMQVVK